MKRGGREGEGGKGSDGGEVSEAKGGREGSDVGGEGGKGLVLGSPVQSGLLSKFDKTETRTGPPRLKNHEKPD